MGCLEGVSYPDPPVIAVLKQVVAVKGKGVLHPGKRAKFLETGDTLEKSIVANNQTTGAGQISNWTPGRVNVGIVNSRASHKAEPHRRRANIEESGQISVDLAVLPNVYIVDDSDVATDLGCDTIANSVLALFVATKRAESDVVGLLGRFLRHRRTGHTKGQRNDDVFFQSASLSIKGRHTAPVDYLQPGLGFIGVFFLAAAESPYVVGVVGGVVPPVFCARS